MLNKPKLIVYVIDRFHLLFTQKSSLWSFRRRFLLLVFVMVICAQLILLCTLMIGSPSGVYIEKVVLTSGIDEANLPINNLFQFSQNNNRIYVFIVTKGVLNLPLRANLLVKWYYQGEQIANHYLEVSTTGPVIIWINPPEGEKFRLGSYTLEIFIAQVLVKTIEFRIE